MKNHVIKLATTLFLVLVLIGCTKDNETDPDAPQIPPYETMAINFDDFKVDDSKSATALNNTFVNWTYAKASVGFFSGIIGLTLIVPVATFYKSFEQKPTYLGDNKWEWKYDVAVGNATYKARMTGELRTSDVKWEMYVSLTGENGFSEFKWFEGTSQIDGTAGQWTLYHSEKFQEEVLTIDWKKSSEKVAEITYTYVREKNNLRQPDVAKGSYLKYGLQESALDAYFKVYFYEIFSQKMVNVDVQWSTTVYNGQVKAPHNYQDQDWHCWNSKGLDTDCK